MVGVSLSNEQIIHSPSGLLFFRILWEYVSEELNMGINVKTYQVFISIDTHIVHRVTPFKAKFWGCEKMKTQSKYLSAVISCTSSTSDI